MWLHWCVAVIDYEKATSAQLLATEGYEHAVRSFLPEGGRDKRSGGYYTEDEPETEMQAVSGTAAEHRETTAGEEDRGSTAGVPAAAEEDRGSTAGEPAEPAAAEEDTAGEPAAAEETAGEPAAPAAAEEQGESAEAPAEEQPAGEGEGGGGGGAEEAASEKGEGAEG